MESAECRSRELLIHSDTKNDRAQCNIYGNTMI